MLNRAFSKTCIKRNSPCVLYLLANAAFVAVMAAEDGINADQFKTWAMSQINYLLGDNKQHMSFEIGFGSRYPTHPHHRGRYVLPIGTINST